MTEHYLDRLARTINENWDQPALTDFYLTEDGTAQDFSRGNHYTYGEMYAEMLRLGKLFASLGLQKGDHIAICGANSAHWAIAYLAIAAYQGVAVTILHSRLMDDMVYQMNFSKVHCLLTDLDLWEDLKGQALLQVENVMSLEDWRLLRGKETKITNRNNRSLESKIGESRIENREACINHRELDDLAMICFTSGSTGEAKGVMLSYRCLSNNIYDTHLIYPKVKGEKILSVFPYGHMLGLHFELLSQLCKGHHIHHFKEIGTVENIYSSIKIVKPYAIATTPALQRLLVEGYGHHYIEILQKSCGYIIMGGAKLNESIVQQMLGENIHIVNAYGMTETGAIVTGSTNNEYRFPSCGKILPGNDILIAPNGEILVKGENVMLGYYKDPEATARKIDKDGWLHTGDKGHLDEDGYLYVEGRLEQDIIVLPNGENIHPEDIECKINALPEVSESIVLARGEKLVAIVVPSSSSSVSIESRESSPSSPILRRKILRAINPELPLYSQLYDVEITDTPLQKTEKQTIKRYLYK